jgi:hypothetical protein
VISQTLKIKYLLALQRKLVQYASFTTAGHTANNPKGTLFCCRIELSNHLPPKALIATIKLNRFPTNTLQYMSEGAATLTTAPAVNQWAPRVWHIHKVGLKMQSNILSHQGSAALLGSEWRFLLIQCTNQNTLIIVEYWAINRTRNMV